MQLIVIRCWQGHNGHANTSETKMANLYSRLRLGFRDDFATHFRKASLKGTRMVGDDLAVVFEAQGKRREDRRDFTLYLSRDELTAIVSQVVGMAFAPSADDDGRC
jgi:hypothetical protein